LELLSPDSSMIFFKNITIFFLSVSPVCFIGIIYLASNLNLMDRQISNISSIREDEAEKKNKPDMNLVCSQASAHGV